MDDTSVFVSVVAKKEAVAGQDFFPLTVNYQERTYAAGKIPGGFFKREGRPSEGETLTARLIDRPIRPLFPSAFKNEVQVIATVVSINPDVNPDMITMIATSAALAISGAPFNGPIGAARVGHIDGELVLNPSNTELENSKLDLVVSGTEGAVLMVESEADNLSEEEMLSAVVYGHDQQQVVIKAINEFAAEVATPSWNWEAPAVNTELKAKVAEQAETRLSDAYQITEKMARYEQVGAIKNDTVEALIAQDENLDEFPYTVRVVSEITESNGSSSMASVCGTSLALMDAGVPIKASVAGIAMGLVKEGDDFVVLSDILGDEDHLGDMDFKVAGTNAGITALQMDIKIEGITKEIMQIALNQAQGARKHILSVMDEAISGAREDISEFAPRIHTMKISSDKIKDVIGKGGAVIRALCEETGTTIEIEDDGTIKIAATEGAAAQEAIRRIEEITAEVEVGRIYQGKVARLADFGAFVTILPGKDGLVHISQIADKRVEKVSDYLTEGQEVPVKVLEIDRQGRVRLSMKEAVETPAEGEAPAAE
ncbi:UNVERIFIED_CONTAM: hypothetical protein GTU68_016187 [Idotea baltica]|nr:hypothetical protein [Idotea baltica]